MKSTRVDADGTVRCPNCGATSFRSQRSTFAKVVGIPTVGVGTFAAPKRLKCDGCGTFLKAEGGQPASRPPVSPTKVSTNGRPSAGDEIHYEFIAKRKVVNDQFRAGELSQAQHIQMTRELVEQEEAAIAALVDGPSEPEPEPAPASSPIRDRLLKLDELLKDGVIYEEEHATRRAEILREI